MTDGDLKMEVLVDMGRLEVVRPEMRESTVLGSARPPSASFTPRGPRRSLTSTWRTARRFRRARWRGSEVGRGSVGSGPWSARAGG
jgi:hypothetical protein